MKNINDLCMFIAKKEGKKQGVNIAQIREIVKVISVALVTPTISVAVVTMLYKNGKKHCKKEA